MSFDQIVPFPKVDLENRLLLLLLAIFPTLCLSNTILPLLPCLGVRFPTSLGNESGTAKCSFSPG